MSEEIDFWFLNELKELQIRNSYYQRLFFCEVFFKRDSLLVRMFDFNYFNFTSKNNGLLHWLLFVLLILHCIIDSSETWRAKDSNMLFSSVWKLRYTCAVDEIFSKLGNSKVVLDMSDKSNIYILTSRDKGAVHQ